MAAANALLRAIASTGRRFFWYRDERGTPVEERVGQFVKLDDSWRLWFVDAYSQTPVYLHQPSWRGWRGFTNGGTMKRLIEHLRDFIRHGTPVPASEFGPWPDFVCGGDLWGYGADMEKIRAQAAVLGVTGAAQGCAA